VSYWGETLQLTATVSGTSNTSVNWSVNGTIGGNITSGTISTAGLYAAPADLPAPANVQITATSAADSASNASAQVTVTSDIVVGISSALTSAELGAKQNFAATLTSAGQPDSTVRWKLSGSSCPSACGVIDANGNFTAPQILPSPAGVIGHFHARVEEVPAFSPGEEAYLFLWTAPNGTYRILGWTQGAFRIRMNQTTGLESVTQDSAAAPFIRSRHSTVSPWRNPKPPRCNLSSKTETSSRTRISIRSKILSERDPVEVEKDGTHGHEKCNSLQKFKRATNGPRIRMRKLWTDSGLRIQLACTGCAPAFVRLGRLGLSGVRPSIDERREHRISLEHRAGIQSGYDFYPESGPGQQVDGN
jgi:hypothetical protein